MIFRLAGEVGVDPGPMTLGELRTMAEGSWQRFANLEAAIRDYASPRKDKLFWDARFFNPYTETKRRSITPFDLHGLKGLASKVTTVLASEIKVQDDAEVSTS